MTEHVPEILTSDPGWSGTRPRYGGGCSCGWRAGAFHAYADSSQAIDARSAAWSDARAHEREQAGPYRIVRHYRDRWPNRRTIARGLTLEQAQAHCQDPETSSSTATGYAARRRTERLSAWFDGYTDRP